MWRAIGEGTDVWISEYPAEGFGRTNCLAIGWNDGTVVLSPSVGPSKSDLDFVRGRGPLYGLLAPHAGHTLGITEWRHHFPEAPVYAAPGSIERLAEVCKVEAKPIEALATDPTVKVMVPKGSKNDSLLLRIERGPRPVVYVNELLVDLEHQPGKGIQKAIFWLAGSRAGLRVNRGYLRFYVPDKETLARETLELMHGDPHVVLAHGPVRSSAADLTECRRLVASV